MHIGNLQKFSRYPKCKQKKKKNDLLQARNNRFLVEKYVLLKKNYSEN